MPAVSAERGILRAPAEVRFAGELAALAAADRDERPEGWRLSPRAVRAFICGSETPPVRRKFYGDDAMVERAIVGLLSDRGLLLVGEPGTAKSMLSELLAAAISGVSTNTIQGTAGTTEDQIRYTWNYALLLNEGPTARALVPAPLHVGMSRGLTVRFEEITRCPPEVQDSLVSVLSEKALVIPELPEGERVLFARPGFNVVATANVRDRGVHEMSSALKRRFHFETVPPIRDLALEVTLVAEETARLLGESRAPVEMPRSVVELLVTAFQDLRDGKTAEGIPVERPAAVMSTAEAVSVGFAAGLDAYYYGAKRVTPELLGRHLSGAVLKDAQDDVKKLRHYFDVVVKERGKTSSLWDDFWKARRHLSGEERK